MGRGQPSTRSKTTLPTTPAIENVSVVGTLDLSHESGTSIQVAREGPHSPSPGRHHLLAPTPNPDTIAPENASMTHSWEWFMAKGDRQRACQRCGEPFEQSRHWQKFCSATCRSGRWIEKRMTRVPDGALVVAITHDHQVDVLRDDRPDPNPVLVHEGSTDRTHALNRVVEQVTVGDQVRIAVVPAGGNSQA